MWQVVALQNGTVLDNTEQSRNRKWLFRQPLNTDFRLHLLFLFFTS